MFINTLAIIFTYTNLLSPIEFAILIILIFAGVYINCPESIGKTYNINLPASAHRRGILESIYWYALKAWLGQQSLLLAFLPFFILVNIVLYYIDYRIFNLDFTVASWKTVHFMLALPTLWWITSVWRCSFNTKNKLACSLTRSCTIYLLMEYVFRYIIFTHYPNTFFDCSLLIVYYGDCF